MYWIYRFLHLINNSFITNLTPFISLITLYINIIPYTFIWNNITFYSSIIDIISSLLITPIDSLTIFPLFMTTNVGILSMLN